MAVCALAEKDILRKEPKDVREHDFYYFPPEDVAVSMGRSMEEEFKSNVEWYGGKYRADWGSEWVSRSAPDLGTLVLSTARPTRGRAPPAKTIGFFKKVRKPKEYWVWWMSEQEVERSMHRV